VHLHAADPHSAVAGRAGPHHRLRDPARRRRGGRADREVGRPDQRRNHEAGALAGEAAADHGGGSGRSGRPSRTACAGCVPARTVRTPARAARTGPVHMSDVDAPSVTTPSSTHGHPPSSTTPGSTHVDTPGSTTPASSQRRRRPRERTDVPATHTDPTAAQGTGPGAQDTRAP
jgi:hypothetical protein